MSPVEFPGCNLVFAKDQPEYMPLPVHKAKDGVVVSCWKLTPEEFVILTETRQIYLTMLTFNQPLTPVLLTVAKPDHI